MKAIFEITEAYAPVNAWIAVSSTMRTVRVTWPWFWGTVGFDVQLSRKNKLRAYTISAWRERKLLETFTTPSIPRSGKPEYNEVVGWGSLQPENFTGEKTVDEALQRRCQSA